MVVSASDLYRDIVAEVFRSREALPVDVWCDRYVELPGKTAAESGRFSTSRTPYLRWPMRLFAHPAVRHLTAMMATQLGKTQLIDNLKLWTIDEDPGPTVVMYANIDAARDYNQDRFLPLVRASQRVAMHLLPSPQETKNLKINFDSMTMWFVGSNSPQGRRMRPARKVFCDEVEAYEDPDWIEIYERVKSFADYKLVDTSSPGDEGAGIHALYLQGTRERYWVPCPHCGRYQILRFGEPGKPGGLHWDGGRRASREQAKATACYVCIGCEGRIYDWHKAAMLERGLWVPEAMDAEEVIEKGQEAVPVREHHSFQLSSLYSPFPGASFGECAAAFLADAGQATRHFVNNWLGEPWVVQQDRLEIREIERHCIPPGEPGGYRLGEVPDGVLGLTVAVDVQKTRLYVGVRGWGERGVDAWLVDLAVLDRVEGRDLLELDAWLCPDGVRRTWNRAGRPERMPWSALAIDSGHYTKEVYAAVRRLRQRYRHVWAIKGQETLGLNKPYTPVVIDKWPDGTPMPGGVHLLHVSVDYWAAALVGRIKGRPEGEIAEGLEPGQVPGLYLPGNADGELNEWMDHVTAEARQPRPVAKGRAGVRRANDYVWAMRPGRTANHFLDVERYQEALADKVGVRSLRRAAPAKAEPAAKRPTPSPLGTPPWARG